MRLRISLFELLLLVIPAVAIALGVCVAALKTPDSWIVLTLAQTAYLVAMLAAVCALFHQRMGVRVFSGAFLAASLGHMLLIWLANQSAYGGSFPTTVAFSAIWDYAVPGQNAPVSVWNANAGGASIWTTSSLAIPPGGYGYSGPGPMYSGMGGSTIPIYTAVSQSRPMFIDVGTWAVSLVLGVICGVIAKAIRGPESEPVKNGSS
jgi:hypothetical protein